MAISFTIRFLKTKIHVNDTDGNNPVTIQGISRTGKKVKVTMVQFGLLAQENVADTGLRAASIS